MSNKCNANPFQMEPSEIKEKEQPHSHDPSSSIWEGGSPRRTEDNCLIFQGKFGWGFFGFFLFVFLRRNSSWLPAARPGCAPGPGQGTSSAMPEGAASNTLRSHRQSCALPWERSDLSPHSPYPEEVLSLNDFLDLLAPHGAFLPSDSAHGQQSRGY